MIRQETTYPLAGVVARRKGGPIEEDVNAKSKSRDLGQQGRFRVGLRFIQSGVS